MYKIDKVKSEFENEWNLFINDAKVGSLEVIFLSETSRTVNGSVIAYTTEGKEVKYEYYGEDTGTPMSISKFISDAEQAIGEQALRLNPGDEYYDDGRLFENVVVIADVTEDNVDDLMEHLKLEKPFGWDNQTPFQKVGYLQTHLREEREKNKACPMRDLVQKSKMGHSRATPLSVHWN